MVDVERRIDGLLSENLSEPEGPRRIRKASRHLALAPAAKRARPRLVFHFGRCVGAKPRPLRRTAVAAELVHTASLLHDDIVDAGALRRGRETVNSRWNDVTAVLAGDALLCAALVELRRMREVVSSRAVDIVAEMTRSILHEVASRRCTDLSREDWRYIATGKTGALFGWCGTAPALEIGDEEAADRFDKCGRNLGIAFQLADDLRDIVPVDSGKDAYADIRNGNPSFPLICAADADDRVRELLASSWSSDEGNAPANPDPARIARAVRATDAIAETRASIRAAVGRALDALGPFAEHRGGSEIARWARRLCAHIRSPEPSSPPPQ